MDDQKKNSNGHGIIHKKSFSDAHSYNKNLSVEKESLHKKNSSYGNIDLRKEPNFISKNDSIIMKESNLYNKTDKKYGAYSKDILNSYNIKEDFRHQMTEREPSSYSVKDGIKHGVVYKCNIYWQNIITAFHYVLNDNKKNPRSLIIGSCTVFLVVFFLCLIQNALNRSSVLLVKAQEDIVGKYDLLLSPATNAEGEYSLLNYTLINQKTQGLSEVYGSAPRWALTAEATNEDYSGSLYAFFLNTTLEKSIGLASHWPFRKLGNNEILLSSSLIRTLHVQPNAGQTITLHFNFTNLLTELYPDIKFQNNIMNDIIDEIIFRTDNSQDEFQKRMNEFLKKKIQRQLLIIILIE